MKTLLFAVAFSLVSVLSTAAWSAVAWDESVSGDLSSDPDAPTTITFSPGSNTVEGTIVAPADTYDYMTFTLEPGQTLSNLLLMEFADITFGGQGNRAFHTIIEGSTSHIPNFSNIGNFLGANHLDFQPTGTDLLPDLAGAPLGGTGFTIPLGPGTYTYHVQQVDASLTGYLFDFIVEEDSVADSADFDGDGDIDGQDFLIWQRGDSPNPLSNEDLALWQNQYGMPPLVAAVSVPEPATISLIVGMLFATNLTRTILPR